MTSLEQLTGHTTVQASGGSCKTYLLISRRVRLLLTGAEAGNILAITFTQKAANEIQTRLIERLFYLATCSELPLMNTRKELQLEPDSKTIALSRDLHEKIFRSQTTVTSSTFHAICQQLFSPFQM